MNEEIKEKGKTALENYRANETEEQKRKRIDKAITTQHRNSYDAAMIKKEFNRAVKNRFRKTTEKLLNVKDSNKETHYHKIIANLICEAETPGGKNVVPAVRELRNIIGEDNESKKIEITNNGENTQINFVLPNEIDKYAN